jgi:hypothetical protein
MMPNRQQLRAIASFSGVKCVARPPVSRRNRPLIVSRITDERTNKDASVSNLGISLSTRRTTKRILLIFNNDSQKPQNVNPI